MSNENTGEMGPMEQKHGNGKAMRDGNVDTMVLPKSQVHGAAKAVKNESAKAEKTQSCQGNEYKKDQG